MSENLTKHLLIAMPSLQNHNFSRTVALVCEHNSHGAMGIVINQPTSMSVEELIDQIDADDDSKKISNRNPVFAGGPVHMNRGFILHDSDREWESTHIIDNDLKLTTSEDILLDIGKGTGPKNSIVALGYAGWAAGQLEQELADNAWLTVSYEAKIVFTTPIEKRWQTAAGKLGIDLHLISSDAGHA
jgi:putative transcriptional regulator